MFEEVEGVCLNLGCRFLPVDYALTCNQYVLMWCSPSRLNPEPLLLTVHVNGLNQDISAPGLAGFQVYLWSGAMAERIQGSWFTALSYSDMDVFTGTVQGQYSSTWYDHNFSMCPKLWGKTQKVCWAITNSLGLYCATHVFEECWCSAYPMIGSGFGVKLWACQMSAS